MATRKGYIKPKNNKVIEDIIKDNVKNMFDKNEFNPNNIMTNDFLDIPFYTTYFEDIPRDNTEVRKGADYWDNKLKEYIKRLENRLKVDISSYDLDTLKDAIVENNKDFLLDYIGGIKNNSLDLANESVKVRYATRLAESLADIQIQEIKENASIIEFLNLQLVDKNNAHTDTANDKIVLYANVNDLQFIQKHIKDVFNKLDYNNVVDANKEQIAESILKQDLVKFVYLEQIKRVDKIYNDNKKDFDKRHKLHIKVNNLISKLANKYKEQANYLNQPRYRAIEPNNDNILEEMQAQDKNIEKAKLTTTLLGNKLFTGNEIEVNQAYEISYLEKSTQKEITTSITIFDDTSKFIKLSKKHKDINDAVGSLIDNGIKYCTLKQLYNFINKGIISNDYVEQENLDALLVELNKMDKKADIDATEQFKLKGYQESLQEYKKKTGKTPRPVISQDLLNFKLLKNVPLPNGDLIDIICFMDYPAVYDFARQFQQLAPYPAEILNLNYSPKSSKNTLQITEITRTIRNELIRAIELRRGGFNQPLVINNFLCNECQFYDVIDKNIIDKNKIHTKVLNKQKRIRYTNNIEVILKNFIDKGYIKGYTINKLGKQNKYSITFKF